MWRKREREFWFSYISLIIFHISFSTIFFYFYYFSYASEIISSFHHTTSSLSNSTTNHNNNKSWIEIRSLFNHLHFCSSRLSDFGAQFLGFLFLISLFFEIFDSFEITFIVGWSENWFGCILDMKELSYFQELIFFFDVCRFHSSYLISHFTLLCSNWLWKNVEWIWSHYLHWKVGYLFFFFDFDCDFDCELIFEKRYDWLTNWVLCLLFDLKDWRWSQFLFYPLTTPLWSISSLPQPLHLTHNQLHQTIKKMNKMRKKKKKMIPPLPLIQKKKKIKQQQRKIISFPHLLFIIFHLWSWWKMKHLLMKSWS